MKCDIHDILAEDIREIKKDVKTLLEYMWVQKGKTIAISAGVSTIIAVVVNFLARRIL